MPLKSLRYMLNLAIIFSLLVVLLGAYTRLTHAGLGCPDWPGCYGKLVLPHTSEALSSAQNQYPDTPIEVGKAWTEMIHRYAAGTLVLLLLAISFSIFRHRNVLPSLEWKLSLVLLLLISFQALLGMWTVTWKLLPLVVMGHLLGGFCIFSGLCRLRFALHPYPPAYLPQWKPWLQLAVLIVFVQIALGGWVSANYAGVACLGFPRCNGQWFPMLHLLEGFNVSSPIGQSYQGGLLDHPGRMTIHFVHRLGAMGTAIYLLSLCSLILYHLKLSRLRLFAKLTMAVVLVQFCLGILNVIYFLPLWVAVLHNGVAALLLATVYLMQALVTRRILPNEG